MKNTAEKLNRNFEKKRAEDILQYILEEYKGKSVFTTSLGAEDQVVTHIMASIDKNSNIITLDTGRMFPEIYDLIEKTEARYDIKINTYFPDFREVEQMVNTKGINLFYKSIENRKLCCQVRKTKPLKRAIQEKEIWITGLRSEQALTRHNLKIAEWDENNKIIKINPLHNWTNKDVWNYIHSHKIPYNPLHEKGYPSIGCQPCTMPVQDGEDIRAGRWWWESPETKECGLHK